MKKQDAIDQLGGTVSAAAREIGCTYHAVNKWPDELPPRIADRVQAALWRKAQHEKAQAEPSTASAGA